MLKKIKFICFVVAMLFLVPFAFAQSTQAGQYTKPEAKSSGYHQTLYSDLIQTSTSGSNSLTILADTLGVSGSSVITLRTIGSGAGEIYVRDVVGSKNLYLQPTAGNVGIGTSTAGSKLTVGGDISGTYIIASAGLTPGTVDTNEVGTGTIRASGSHLEYYDGGKWVTFVGTTGSPIIWTRTGDLVYYNAGNVGIGTGMTTPQRTLDVAGTARFSGDTNVGGDLSVTKNIVVGGGAILRSASPSNINALTFDGTGTTVVGQMSSTTADITGLMHSGSITTGTVGATSGTFSGLLTANGGVVVQNGDTVTMGDATNSGNKLILNGRELSPVATNINNYWTQDASGNIARSSGTVDVVEAFSAGSLTIDNAATVNGNLVVANGKKTTMGSASNSGNILVLNGAEISSWPRASQWFSASGGGIQYDGEVGIGQDPSTKLDVNGVTSTDGLTSVGTVTVTSGGLDVQSGTSTVKDLTVNGKLTVVSGSTTFSWG